MKTIFSIVTAVCLFSASLFSQNPNHSTVEKVIASYKIISSGTNPASADIRVQAKVSVTLKNAGTVTKIYIKVADKQTNAVVYNVNYVVSSAALTDDSGVTLFKKDGNIIQITDPAPVLLKPYVYEVTTEDLQGVKSIPYSVTQ